MGYQNLSDEELALAALRNGDAFAEMAERYYNRVYFTALAMTRHREMAEDIAQETFLRVWLKRKSITDKPLLLQPWLIRIARNLAVDWLRSGQQRSRVLPLISMEEITVEPADNTKPDPRQAAGHSEQHSQLNDAVMALPEELRQAVLLHYGDGLTASDIARMNGEAPSTVTRRLDKAREQLRAHLENGLVQSLASMRPQPRQIQRALIAITAAVALPAATQAKLLHLTANTPPPPLIETVTSAAAAAPTGETSIMKSIIAKLGATKLLTGIAAAAVIGGGAYGVVSLNRPSQASHEPGEHTSEQTARLGFNPTVKSLAATTHRNPNKSGSHENSNARTSSTSSPTTDTSKRSRITTAERIAALKNDLVSTQPEFVKDDGKTSGGTYLNMQVADGSGLPVEGATINIWGLRYKEDHISGSIGLPQDISTTAIITYGAVIVPATTNAAGVARVFVPLYVQSKYRTRGFNIRATHPNYTATFADIDLANVTKVIMTGGQALELLPVDQITSEPIRANVKPEFDTSFKPEWEQRSDGTIAIRKISGENLPLYLTYTDSKGNVHLSGHHDLKVPYVGEQPVKVPFVAGHKVRGRLSANVPRPVSGGRVQARSAAGPMCSKYAWQEVAVQPDGSFELNNMPIGDVLIAALADGYNSTEPVNEPNHSPHAIPHRFKLVEDQQGYELPMEARANLKIKIVDAAGTPVAGVNIRCGSMLSFDSCCEDWGGKFMAASGADGIAEILNIPASQKTQIYAVDGWQVRGKESVGGVRANSVSVELNPGEQEIEITVEQAPTSS